MKRLTFTIGVAALVLVLAAGAIVMQARLSIRPGVGSVLGGIPGTLRPTPPRRGPIRQGGDIHPPRKIRHVDPIYPALALECGVGGIVIVDLTIDESGPVTEARVLRSAPGFDEAALEAARQWEFTPTMLNGEPWPIVMTTTVTFEPPGGAAATSSGRTPRP